MKKSIHYINKLMHNWEDSILDYLPKIFLSIVILITILSCLQSI